MNNLNPFPWHYFVRTIRSRITLIVLCSLVTFVISRVYSEYIFPKVLIAITIFITISIIQGYIRIIPFRKLLRKIEDIQVQLPHNKKLNIIYQKNEWILIQEMLKLTEKYIQEQSEEIQVRDQQTDIIIESIADPLILLDSFLNFKQYNQSFREIFIQDKVTKILKDDKLWKIFEDHKILDLFQNAKDKGEISRLSAHKINHEYFNIAVTPIIDKQGFNIGLLGLFHNVTDSMLTEKMRVDFVANVSHEIRTPITSIKGFSQVLLAQKEGFSKEMQAPLERIVHNTERLQDLFDNLLKLSIIESKYGIEKELFDLTKLVLSIQKNLQHKHPNKNVELTTSKSQPIYGDKKLLEQVFTNLIDNSIKYNPNQNTSIHLSTNQVLNRDIITIQDDGPGIEEFDLKRIFERFYRTQGQNQQHIEGAGLGLSIVKHIINKHNGQIRVESKVNKGTKFTIELPST